MIVRIDFQPLIKVLFHVNQLTIICSTVMINVMNRMNEKANVIFSSALPVLFDSPFCELNPVFIMVKVMQ